MKNKAQEQAIVNILNDYILWLRVEESLFLISNAFNPSKKMCHNWQADNNYKGFDTAILLLGIKDNDTLCGDICTKTFNMIKDSDKASTDLAKELFIEWLLIIKDHFTVKSAA